jgi:hypothetical protein
MAVENKYITDPKTDGYEGKLTTLFRGDQLVSVVCNFEVAAADSNGSVYRIAKLNKNLIPVEIWLTCSAMTGATDYDIGLYRTQENGGDAADADCFDDGTDVSAGKTIASPLNGLTDLGIDNIGDQIWQLAGAASSAAADPEYDLAVTANTVGTEAGTVQVRALFVRTT